MRIYLAGPMSGIPQFNIPQFTLFAHVLRDEGHDVVSPAELDGEEVRSHLLLSQTGSPDDYPTGVTWGDFLSRDVKQLADDGIEAVVALPGWASSKGARLETYVAHALCGLPVLRMTVTEGEVHLRELNELELIRGWAGRRDIMLYGYAPGDPRGGEAW